MTDFHRILARLLPEADGEGQLVYRKGTVDAVGSGVVDLIISGVIVPDVPIHGSASVSDEVHVLASRGIMLAIGADSGGSGGHCSDCDLGDLADVSFGTLVHGDMIYRNSTGDWVVVGGTKATGRVPTIQGSGAVEWAAGGGGGGDASPDSWEEYTPTLTATTTNPTLGNGVLIGWFRVAEDLDGNHWVDGRVRLVWGSSGTAAGSGTYSISRPVSGSPVGFQLAGSGIIVDAGSNARPVVADVGSASVEFRCWSPGATPVTHNSPFSWASGDTLEFEFRYRYTP